FSQLLETLVFFQPSLDRFFPGRKVLVRLSAYGIRHQARGFELDQSRADHEESGQPVKRGALLVDRPQIVVGEIREGDSLQVDLRPLGEREKQFDRPVEGRCSDDIDWIAFELRGHLRAQFRPSARFRRRVTSDAGFAAWCSATMAASSSAPSVCNRSAPIRAWS